MYHIRLKSPQRLALQLTNYRTTTIICVKLSATQFKECQCLIARCLHKFWLLFAWSDLSLSDKGPSLKYFSILRGKIYIKLQSCYMFIRNKKKKTRKKLIDLFDIYYRFVIVSDILCLKTLFSEMIKFC